MLTVIFILGCLGLVISLYGISVERALQKNPLYKPACDISDQISCTKAVLSPYGKLYGIPIIYFGFLYYTAVIIASIAHLITISFVLSCIGIMTTIILAYILYFKIKTFCLLCTSLYILNIVLFMTNYIICCW